VPGDPANEREPEIEQETVEATRHGRDPEHPPSAEATPLFRSKAQQRTPKLVAIRDRVEPFVSVMKCLLRHALEHETVGKPRV